MSIVIIRKCIVVDSSTIRPILRYIYLDIILKQSHRSGSELRTISWFKSNLSVFAIARNRQSILSPSQTVADFYIRITASETIKCISANIIVSIDQ